MAVSALSYLDEKTLGRLGWDERKSLERLCEEWGLNPYLVVGEPALVRYLAGITERPSEEVGGKFLDTNDLFVFVNTVCLPAKEMKRNPFAYLGSSMDDYAAALRRVRDAVLPEEEQDSRVEKVLRRVREGFEGYTGPAVVPAVTGSFYFGDPSTDPDLDLYLIVSNGAAGRPLAKNIGEKSRGMHVECRVLDVSEFNCLANAYARGDELPEYQAISLVDDSLVQLFHQPVSVPSLATERIEDTMGRNLGLIHALAESRPVYRAGMVACMDSILYDRGRKDRPARAD